MFRQSFKEFFTHKTNYVGLITIGMAFYGYHTDMVTYPALMGLVSAAAGGMTFYDKIHGMQK